MLNLKSIESQAVDGMVVTRIIQEDDTCLLEYTLSPIDAMHVARTQMEKAAEAVTQPAVVPSVRSGKHRRTED